jgi:hypothetical protein
MKPFFLCVFLAAALLAALPAIGQSAADSTVRATYARKRIVGLNMTPLVTQLIPLNRSDSKEAGPFLLRFKKYGSAGRSAFRFSLGFHLRTDENGEVDDPQFSFALGWEKRRSISRRWSYTRGFDFMVLGGDLNIPGNNTLAEDEVGIGFAVGPVWGMEYAIDPRVTLGVEAALAIGWSPGFEGVIFEVLPPVGLFLSHYF